MARLIDADALMETIRAHDYPLRVHYSNGTDNGMFTNGIQQAVDEQPTVDAVELNRDKLIELLSRYFSIGDSDTYELTRVKEAFEIGAMTFDDFVEWNEDNVADLADWLIKELRKEKEDGRTQTQPDSNSG